MGKAKDKEPDGDDKAIENENHHRLDDDDAPIVSFDTYGMNDVICGRGGGSNNHPGNVYWRMLVKRSKRLYICSVKRQKMKVAKSVVNLIRTRVPPGHFLEKDAKTGKWVEIGQRRSVDKTSQALRESAPFIRQEMGVDLEKNKKYTAEINEWKFLCNRHASDTRRYAEKINTGSTHDSDGRKYPEFPPEPLMFPPHMSPTAKQICITHGIMPVVPPLLASQDTPCAPGVEGPLLVPTGPLPIMPPFPMTGFLPPFFGTPFRPVPPPFPMMGGSLPSLSMDQFAGGAISPYQSSNPATTEKKKMSSEEMTFSEHNDSLMPPPFSMMGGSLPSSSMNQFAGGTIVPYPSSNPATTEKKEMSSEKISQADQNDKTKGNVKGGKKMIDLNSKQDLSEELKVPKPQVGHEYYSSDNTETEPESDDEYENEEAEKREATNRGSKLAHRKVSNQTAPAKRKRDVPKICHKVDNCSRTDSKDKGSKQQESCIMRTRLIREVSNESAALQRTMDNIARATDEDFLNRNTKIKVEKSKKNKVEKSKRSKCKLIGGRGPNENILTSRKTHEVICKPGNSTVDVPLTSLKRKVTDDNRISCQKRRKRAHLKRKTQQIHFNVNSQLHDTVFFDKKCGPRRSSFENAMILPKTAHEEPRDTQRLQQLELDQIRNYVNFQTSGQSTSFFQRTPYRTHQSASINQLLPSKTDFTTENHISQLQAVTCNRLREQNLFGTHSFRRQIEEYPPIGIVMDNRSLGHANQFMRSNHLRMLEIDEKTIINEESRRLMNLSNRLNESKSMEYAKFNEHDLMSSSGDDHSPNDAFLMLVNAANNRTSGVFPDEVKS